MATKYIVNNAVNQTIEGDLMIEGSLKSNSMGVYKALLSQTGTLVGTNISTFNYGLIKGELYTITNYVSGDDFDNIADVQSGVINQTGCQFIATGEVPTIWQNGSELTSDGGLVVEVLENTLGYDLSWTQSPFGGYGYYIAINDTTGPLLNSFSRGTVQFNTQGSFNYISLLTGTVSYFAKDSMLGLNVFDLDLGDLTDNYLYYTPVDIIIKQDLDTTPINVYGLNVSSFPYGNVSVRLYAGDPLNSISVFYGSYTQVNDMEELVAKLNSDTDTNFLGTYTVNQDVENGVILAMPTNLKNQFSPDNTLTFEVFND